MSEVVNQALILWGIEGAKVTLAAARENQVFKVGTSRDSFALRLHRPGYRSDQELRSELEWMTHLAERGMAVPRPVISQSGAYVHQVGDYQVDLLTWLQGETLRSSVNGLSQRQIEELFANFGRQLAKLHLITDKVSFSLCTLKAAVA